MSEQPDPMRKQARIASIVIAVTMLLWMLGSWIGGQLGLQPRYAFLLDMAALAALFWALVVLVRVWRNRQPEG